MSRADNELARDATVRRALHQKADAGKHYRYQYKGIKLDPYRVAKVYAINGGPQEHILKKILRGTTKGHTEQEVINEIQACLDRWQEMIKEDITDEST